MHRAVVHGNEAVAEGPRGEDRDRDEGAVAGDVARNVLGGGELGRVEFLVADHAVEDVAWVVDREEVEVYSFWLHFPRVQRIHAVCQAAGKGERDFGHFVVRIWS